MSRLRRLMANDVAYGLVLLVFVAAVVAWVYGPHGHRRTIVQTTTTVLVAPPATPLPRDSGPKNNARPKVRQHGSQTNRTTESPGGNVPSAQPQNRPLPSPRRQTAHTKPEHRHAPQKPQGPPPPPPPAVGVTVPAPVTVCARPVAGINC